MADFNSLMKQAEARQIRKQFALEDECKELFTGYELILTGPPCYDVMVKKNGLFWTAVTDLPEKEIADIKAVFEKGTQ